MGTCFFTNAAGGSRAKVEYTFGYERNADGKLRICLHDSSVPFSLPPSSQLPEQDVKSAQAAWANAIKSISTTYLNGGDYVAAAAEADGELYGYGHTDVLFKPTKAADAPFRPTAVEATSYFVGHEAVEKGYAEDAGFAINGGKGWSNVVFENHQIDVTGNTALAMGTYFFTSAADGSKTKVEYVEYTFGNKKNADGKVRIFLHHSSVPFSVTPTPPTAAITEAEVKCVQAAWARVITSISMTYLDGGDCVAAATEAAGALYGYGHCNVLFKPTKAAEAQFRPTAADVVSYFVGHKAVKNGYAEDAGFAINGGKGWFDVVFESHKVDITGDVAVAMGTYFFSVLIMIGLLAYASAHTGLFVRCKQIMSGVVAFFKAMVGSLSGKLSLNKVGSRWLAIICFCGGLTKADATRHSTSHHTDMLLWQEVGEECLLWASPFSVEATAQSPCDEKENFEIPETAVEVETRLATVCASRQMGHKDSKGKVQGFLGKDAVGSYTILHMLMAAQQDDGWQEVQRRLTWKSQANGATKTQSFYTEGRWQARAQDWTADKRSTVMVKNTYDLSEKMDAHKAGAWLLQTEDDAIVDEALRMVTDQADGGIAVIYTGAGREFPTELERWQAQATYDRVPGVLSGQGGATRGVRSRWVFRIGKAPPALAARMETKLDLSKRGLKDKADDNTVVIRMRASWHVSPQEWQSIVKSLGTCARRWASTVGDGVTPFDLHDTWGWEVWGRKQDEVRGLMRVQSVSVAQALLQQGGQNVGGVTFFPEALAADGRITQSPFYWLQWHDQETWDAYTARARAQSTKGLLLGAHGLGIRCDEGDTKVSTKKRQWKLLRVPAKCDHTVVTEIVTKLGFGNIELTGRGRTYRGHTNWFFQASREDAHQYVQVTVQLSDDEDMVVTAVQELKARWDNNQRLNLRDERRIRYKETDGNADYHGDKRDGKDTRTGHEGRDNNTTNGTDMDTKEFKEGDADHATDGAGNKREAAEEVQASAKKARTPWKPALGKRLPNAGGGDCLWYGIARIMSTANKPRSHRQVRLWVHSYMQDNFAEYEDLWKGAGSHDHMGKMNAIPNFQQYLDGLAQVGTYAGALEILAFAKLEDKRIWVHHEDGRVFEFNEKGKGDAHGFFFYGRGHYEIYDDIDELEWIREQKRQAKEGGQNASQPPLRGGARGLSEFASSAGSVVSSRTKAGAAKQSVPRAPVLRGGAKCLSDFASCSEVRPKRALTEFASSKRASSAAGKRRRTTTASTMHEVEGATRNQPAAVDQWLADQEHYDGKQGKPVAVLNLKDLTTDGKPPAFQWPCNICHQIIGGASSRQLTWRRRNHINCIHPDVDASEFTTIRQFQQRPQVVKLRKSVAARWRCSWCGMGIPQAEAEGVHWDRISTSGRAHLSKCEKAPEGATMKQNRMNLWKQQGIHCTERRFKGSSTGDDEQSDDVKQQLRSQGHQPVVFGSGFLRHTSKFHVTCQRCTTVWWGFARAQRSTGRCPGKGRRQQLLRHPQRRQLWKGATTKLRQCLRKAWKLDHGEVRRLGGWRRNLLDDGDIESNPGPSSRHHHTLRWASLNVQGFNNAFLALDTLASQGDYDVICFQEARLDAWKAQQYRNKAARGGFVAWTRLGTHATSRRGVGYERWGLITLVRQTLKSVLCVNEGNLEDGELLAVQVGDTVIFNCYRPAESTCFGALLQRARGSALTRNYVMVGDFNLSIEDHGEWDDLGLIASGVHDGSEYVPSRWDGSACIDYVLSPPGMLQGPVSYREDRLSDHKCVQGKIQGRSMDTPLVSFAPTLDLSKPEAVSKQEWQRAVLRAWQDQEPTPPAGPEEEWRSFCAKVESACVQAKARWQPVHKPPHCRAKGSWPEVVVEERNTKVQDTFRLRRLSNATGLAREILRQRTRNPLSDTAALEHKLIRSWPTGVPRLATWQDRVRDLEAAYARELQLRLQERLRRWRRRVSQCGKAATNWLARKDIARPPALQIRTDDGHSRLTQDVQEQLHEVKAFWKRVWDRPLPDRMQAIRAWTAHVRPSAAFANNTELADIVTGAHLQNAAAHLGEGSAGPDGWSGSELRHLPLEIYEEYARLLLRWFARGELPKILCGARQIHLPKCDVDQISNSIPVDKMRPISVFSCFWRIVGSMLAKHPLMVQWMNDLLPAAQHGAVKGRSLFGAVRDLAKQFHEEQGILVSLDLKQAFDRMDPTLGLELMRSAGLPASITSALATVWTKQYRWIQIGRSSQAVPELVSSSLPQGDGMCPLCLNVAMLGPVLHMLHTFNPRDLTLAVFLDDRSFVARTAEIVAEGRAHWRRWTRTMGWEENDAKVKVVCRRECQMAEVRAQGVHPGHIVEQATVLGVDFTQKLRRAQREQLDERVRSAEDRARRLAITTLACQVKRFQQWYRKAFYVHRVGSPDLQLILDGHGLQFSFVANAQSLWEFYRSIGPSSTWSGKEGTWYGHVRRFLEGLGWHCPLQVHPWAWQHAELGFQAVLGAPGQLRGFQHQVRETWRYQRYQAFLNSNRRDANVLQAVGYSTERLGLVHLMILFNGALDGPWSGSEGRAHRKTKRTYFFTSAADGSRAEVEYTFGHERNADGKLRIGLHHSSVAFSLPPSSQLSEQDVKVAQAAWANAIKSISTTYLNGGDYVAAAAEADGELYGYGHTDVLFKPTKAADAPFRPTAVEATSYFVGHEAVEKGYAEDAGFAINGGKGWSNVVFENHQIDVTGNTALAMGTYFFTSAADGSKTKVEYVEYTFGNKKNADGKVRIFLHHSSVPFSVTPTPPTAAITEAEVKCVQAAWARVITSISMTYLDGGDCVAAATEAAGALYGYGHCNVLFKPTKAAEAQFRPTAADAVSYFVGHKAVKNGYAEDAGFAINGGKGWFDVVFESHKVDITGDVAVAMGTCFFTNAAGGSRAKVEYTFGYERNADGKLRICLHDSSVPFSLPPSSQLPEQDVKSAQAAWANAIKSISTTYLNGGDYVAAAAEADGELYGYGHTDVLFKPTKAADAPFRPTAVEATSYFVGHEAVEKGYAEDAGFAINGGKGWSNVVFENHQIDVTGNTALAMGTYFFTSAADGSKTKVEYVEYTFGNKKNADGKVRIFLHHSSVPFSVTPTPPTAAITEAEVKCVQAAWARVITSISMTYLDGGDCVAAATEAAGALYGYGHCNVLFKSTKATEAPFRPTAADAVSYFVGHEAVKNGYAEDAGFAINGGKEWSDVVFQNHKKLM
ncbi:Pol [Symbiodinium sp. CCMP2592]|nr:Pol [Symbiodinium sp. CCMP2592]